MTASCSTDARRLPPSVGVPRLVVPTVMVHRTANYPVPRHAFILRNCPPPSIKCRNVSVPLLSSSRVRHAGWRRPCPLLALTQWPSRRPLCSYCSPDVGQWLSRLQLSAESVQPIDTSPIETASRRIARLRIASTTRLSFLVRTYFKAGAILRPALS